MKTNQFLPDGRTALFGLVGCPVAHSLSPAMQTVALREVGLNAVYLPFHIPEIRPEELKQAFSLIGVKGFNITIPHKSNIIACLDEITPQASFLNSVNTVVVEDGHWRGLSTDGAGFIEGLKEVLKDGANGLRVQLLGAGGSASAVAWSLLDAGARQLRIHNRTESKAAELAMRLESAFPGADVSSGLLDEPFDLLVNTTAVGMSSDSLPCSQDLVGLAGAVSDIIYSPPETPLLMLANKLGKKTQNGLPMLLHQGALAFRAWTGKEPPLETMRRILKGGAID